MPVITNIDGLSSKLSPELDKVATLEVDLFEGGNFGDIYACLSINGAAPQGDYFVKLFNDNGFGSARQCFTTVQKLQHKIVEVDRERQSRGQAAIGSIPSLSALPLFSFLGELNGRQVLGYAMRRLDKAGYVPFSKILEDVDLRTRYRSLSLEDRLFLCYELAECFQILSDGMSFIHADVNPPNLFVNIDECYIAPIDFDSGAVTDDPDEKPGTFGKTIDGHWLAPEILDQMRVKGKGPTTVKVDRFTDIWAVTVAIHHLLFLIPPLFYLKASSSPIVRQYLATQKWPVIDVGDPLFDTYNGPALYGHYRDMLRDLPDVVLQKLSAGINNGYTNPSQRTSYTQWVLILRNAQLAPAIDFFEVDHGSIVQGMTVRLTWSAQHAYQVTIDPGIGVVAPQGFLDLSPAGNETYSIVAQARNGTAVSSRVDVLVWPIPEIKTMLVPAPRMNVKLRIEELRIPAPNIHLPANVNLTARLNLGSVANTPRLTSLSPPPAPEELRIGDSFKRLKARITQLAGGAP